MENETDEEKRRHIIERHSRRLQDLNLGGDDDYKSKTGGFNYTIEVQKSTYVQKPVVGKLNPMLVLGVRFFYRFYRFLNLYRKILIAKKFTNFIYKKFPLSKKFSFPSAHLISHFR